MVIRFALTGCGDAAGVGEPGKSLPEPTRIDRLESAADGDAPEGDAPEGDASARLACGPGDQLNWVASNSAATITTPPTAIVRMELKRRRRCRWRWRSPRSGFPAAPSTPAGNVSTGWLGFSSS
jgi:hypothetical protein